MEENSTINPSAMANFGKSPHLAMILTNRCNLNCSYCLREKTPADIPLDKLKHIIQAAHEYGYRSVGLTGGEILLYPGLKELLTYISSFKWTVLFETNGVLFNQEWMDFIASQFEKDKLYFSVSLDSHERKIHDGNRGQGSFNRAVSAIKIIKSSGYELRLIAVLSGKNMVSEKAVNDYLSFCERLNIDSVNFQNIVPVGKNGSQYRKRLKRIQDFPFKVVEEYQGKMSVTGPGRNGQQELLKCRRLENADLCFSAAGIHPCIFAEEIIIGSLDDFSLVKGKLLQAFSVFRKHALLLQGKRYGHGCSDCIKSIKTTMDRMHRQPTIRWKQSSRLGNIVKSIKRILYGK